jgi:hypothetical protein
MNGATMGATNLGSTTTTKITNYPLNAWYVVAWGPHFLKRMLRGYQALPRSFRLDG